MRERKEDIPAIASALVRDLNQKHGCRATHLNPEVLRRFRAGSWPGNVRELRNVIERAVILAGEGEIQPWHLPAVWAPPPAVSTPRIASGDKILQMPVGARMEEVEDAYLRLTLEYTNNNKTRAAELLGLSLRTLHNKIHSSGDVKTRVAGAD